MRVNQFAMPILLLAALLGTVLVAQATGNFQTNGRAGTDITRLTPADLKGWMTLQDVMSGLQISKQDLYAAGKIPADTPETSALNKLEAKVPGFSVSALRETLAATLGSSGSSKAPTTQPGAPGPSTNPAPTTVPTSAPVAETYAAPTPLPAGQILPANQIKGSMSLKNVSDQCAVPMDKLLAGLKLAPNTDSNTLIKDLVAQGKLAEVTAVQKLVDELQAK